MHSRRNRLKIVIQIHAHTHSTRYSHYKNITMYNFTIFDVLIYTWNIAVDMIIKKCLLANMTTKANINVPKIVDYHSSKNWQQWERKRERKKLVFSLCYFLLPSFVSFSVCDVHVRFKLWSYDEFIWWNYWEITTTTENCDIKLVIFLLSRENKELLHKFAQNWDKEAFVWLRKITWGSFHTHNVYENQTTKIGKVERSRRRI